MPEATLRIEFDDVYDPKKLTFLGPYSSHQALEDSCVVSDGAEEGYEQWKGAVGGGVVEGSILAPFYNDICVGRTLETLKMQMAQFIGQPKADDAPPDIEFQLSPCLEEAFRDVAAEKGDESVRVLAFEGTRETVAMALRDAFPGKTVEVIGVCERQDDVDARNGIVADALGGGQAAPLSG